jgi:WD40 repeat protein
MVPDSRRRLNVKIRKKVLILSLATILSACATATPKINIKSGDMTMEVTSLVPIVMSVDWSKDGKTIASGGWDQTVRLWDSTNGKEVRRLQGHTGKVAKVAFSPDSKTIFSGSHDGTLRQWDLAHAVEIRKFDDFASGPNANFDPFSFSPDGKYVLMTRSGKTQSLYDVKSGNKVKDYPGEYPVISAAYSPDSKYVLLVEYNKWGNAFFSLQSADTGRQQWRTKIVSSFIGPYAVFSNDGRFIASTNTHGQTIWSLSDSVNVIDAQTGVQIRRFGEQTGAFSVLKFSPDGKYVLTGDVHHTYRLWDFKTGTMVRQWLGDQGQSRAMLSASAAFSPDGRKIVTADDATIRICDVSTGDELATMIAFENGEWLVSTPNGYYNSSEKGDQYLSVTVGGKPYSISQLRESFYRPDLVKLALSGGSLKEFKKMADIQEPPSVAIVDSPKSINKDEAVITLKITDAGGGIGDVRLYLNGSAIILDGARGVAIVPKSSGPVYKTYTVKLTNGLNTIRAIAFNTENTMQSSDAIHEITATFKSINKPTMYALVIGINDFKNPKLKLTYPVADAELFANTLTDGAKGLFDKVIIKKLVTSQETTKENIVKELRAYRSLNPDDLFVFYVASHGTVDDGEYFLITSNVGSTRTGKLRSDAITQTLFKELVSNIPATKKLIIIDTCNAGALGDAIQTAMLTRGMSEDTAMKILSRAVGSTILSASTSVQEALEGYQGHGLFTYVVSEGLKGKADKGKSGFVKTNELAVYVDDEVPVLAERVFKRAQYPTANTNGMGFPIGKVR